MDSRKIFLIELHEIIKNSSKIRDQLAYPTEENNRTEQFKLNIEEVAALKNYDFDDAALSAIEKIVRDNMMGAFFDAFSLMDAVGDPEIMEVDKTWLGLTLLERKVDEEEDDDVFLHDEFFEVYWDWLEQRKIDD